MTPEEVENCHQKWGGDLARVGLSTARTHCQWKVFEEDDEVLLTQKRGPDRDEFLDKIHDSDELLNAFRVRLLYRVLQDVWRLGRAASLCAFYTLNP
ncbi:hypothetical protein BGZ68_007045 [Mortierella alpina]|nr:hypothetical protein BGZ68_007045 [Mortierella alpina]